jgi:hypothetical protein
VASLASFNFLSRRSAEFYSDWDGIANAAVGRPPRSQRGQDAMRNSEAPFSVQDAR